MTSSGPALSRPTEYVGDAHERAIWARLALVAYAVTWLVVPALANQLLGGQPSWIPVGLLVAVAVAGFIRWPVWTLAVFVAFMLFIDTIELVAGSQVSLTDELVVPAFVAVTIVRERRRLLTAIHPIRDGALIAFVAAGLASSLANGVSLGIWLPGLALVIKGIAVFYVGLFLRVSARDLRETLGLFLGLGLVVLFFGLVELVAPSLSSVTGGVTVTNRAGLPSVKSIFYHPQLFGWFCAVVALQLAAHHVVFRRRWMLALSLLFAVGTILSARRRSIIGLGAALGSGIGTELLAGRRGLRQRLGRWLPSTVGIAILVIAFLPALTGLYALSVEEYVEPPAGVGGSPTVPTIVDTPARIALYTTSVRIASDEFPLGVGLGRYGSWISRDQYSDVYRTYGLDRTYGLSPANRQYITDTFWPQVLGETGLLGLVAYVVFLATVGWTLWRSVATSTGWPAIHAFALGMSLILAQSLVESVASAIFNSPSQVYLVWAGVGTAIAAAAIRSDTVLELPVVAGRAGPLPVDAAATRT